MDYESIHGKGDSNFSSPLSHRMPTVSAAQALQDLKSSPARYIFTSLSELDSFLQNRNDAGLNESPLPGGISRGKVTEIYGPPGVGKTAMGIQLAVNTLCTGNAVCWVDAGSPLCGTRLLDVLNSQKVGKSSETAEEQNSLLQNLTHITVPSLSHLLAFLAGQVNTHPAQNVSLLIIDSFSTLINNAFPRTTDTQNTPKKSTAHKQSSRKFPILQYIINALQKLAATLNIAIVILSQCVTKMRPGAGAVLIPAVNTTAWEQGLGARVALFRDLGWDDEDGNPVDGVRFAQVLKAEGVNLPDGRLHPVAFTIIKDGLQALHVPVLPSFEAAQRSTNVHGTTNSSHLPAQKRKLVATEFEVPDSDAEDDEDYGWAEEDEQELPAPPPQWQGSEDILITRADQLEEEEDEEGEATLDFQDNHSPQKKPAKI